MRQAIAFVLVAAIPAAAAETWRGLAVEAENRCSAYEQRHYERPSSLKEQIIVAQGGLWSPYSIRRFEDARDTDIAHVVARSEAHDSGMCGRARVAKRAFARDLLNLTLASPELNRHKKGANDAGEWLPEHNRCWYAQRVVQVKRKWQLSVDEGERDALKGILAACVPPMEPEKPPT